MGIVKKGETAAKPRRSRKRKSGVTPTAIYEMYMEEAGRETHSQYTPASKIRESQPSATAERSTSDPSPGNDSPSLPKKKSTKKSTKRATRKVSASEPWVSDEKVSAVSVTDKKGHAPGKSIRRRTTPTRQERFDCDAKRLLKLKQCRWGKSME